MTVKDKDGLPGLRVETAASFILRDMMQDYMAKFYVQIRTDRACGQAVSAAFIDGLAGATALVIAGGHASKEDAIYATVLAFKNALERDLSHLRPN